MEIPKLKSHQFSLLLSELETGIIYNPNFTIFKENENKNVFQIFENLTDAENLALETVKNNPKFECLIYDSCGSFVKVIHTNDFEINEISNRLNKLNQTTWKAFIEGKDFTSGSSFIMVNSEKQRETDIEILGANDEEIEFIANSKTYIKFLLEEIEKLKHRKI